MAGTLIMNAEQASRLLDGIDDALLSFARQHHMHLRKNTHFEAINRELRWREDGNDKAINIEYTYTDDPLFEVSVSVTSVRRFRRKAAAPVWHPVRVITLPVTDPEIDDLLVDSKTQLDAS